jgi:pentatricopeptide repeat protein
MVRILFQVARQSGVPLDLATMNNVLRFFGHHPTRGVEAASKVLVDLRERGMNANADTYESMLSILMRNGRVEDAMPLLKRMKATGHLSSNVRVIVAPFVSCNCLRTRTMRCTSFAHRVLLSVRLAALPRALVARLSLV